MLEQLLKNVDIVGMMIDVAKRNTAITAGVVTAGLVAAYMSMSDNEEVIKEEI